MKTQTQTQTSAVLVASHEELLNAARLSLAIIDPLLLTDHRPSREELSKARRAIENGMLLALGKRDVAGNEIRCKSAISPCASDDAEYTPDRRIAAGDYVRKDGRFQRVLSVSGAAVFTEDGGVMDESELRLSDIKLASEVQA